MDHLVEEIRRLTQSDTVSINADGIIVAGTEPVDVLLAECLALATFYDTNPGNFLPQLEMLFPKIYTHLTANTPLLTGDATGAEFAKIQCLLGINPFQKDTATTDTLELDSIEYKQTAIARITAKFAMETDKPRTLQKAEPIPPSTTIYGQYRAHLPPEVLIALVEMLFDTGTTQEFLARLADKTIIPRWYQPAQSTVQTYTFEDNTVFVGPFSEKSNLAGLLRAVIAIERLRDHLIDPAFLPVLLDWDIHPTTVNANTFLFTVLVKKQPKSASVSNVTGMLTDFAKAAWDALSLYPLYIPKGAAYFDKDSQFHMTLHAFLGAQFPGLPDCGMPSLWKERRNPAIQLNDWYGSKTSSQPPSDGNPDTFPMRKGGHARGQERVQQMVMSRLAMNPYCRQCAGTIDRPGSLICSKH